MMSIDKLLAAGSSSLRRLSDTTEATFFHRFGQLGSELFHFLRMRNGFFAFEAALHVFPSGGNGHGFTLELWNRLDTWRSAYGNLIPKDALFFAQDVFGNQFALTQSGVCLFYSEFAEMEPISQSLEGWANILIDDWRSYTGYDLAHEWQIAHGCLKEGERLIPKIPFVLGGKFESQNLYVGKIVDAMLFRASLANQLINVPDGTLAKIQVDP